MRKTIVVVVIFVLLCSSAFAENNITFQGISWMENELYVFQQMKEHGLVMDEGRLPLFTYEQTVYLVDEEMDIIIPSRIEKYNSVCASFDLKGIIHGKIAGYPIKNIVFSFAYDGTYKLIAVKVELINADFSELRSKLNRVYGNAEEKKIETIAESYLWKGTENTAVLLYTDNEERSYTLMYGRLDATSILEDCLNTNIEDISGL